MNRSRTIATLRLALIPLIVAIAALVAWRLGYFDLDHRRTLVKTVEQIRALPAAPLLFLAAFAVAISVCLPSNVGTWVAGAVFGTWIGAALSLIGSLLATVLGYTLARTIAKRPAQRLFGEHRLMRSLRNHDGVISLFQMRVIPIAPFAVLTYVAGIAGVSLRRLLLATAIGSLPTSVANAFVGTQLMQGLASDSGNSRRALLIAIGITLLMLAISLVVGIARRRHRPH